MTRGYVVIAANSCCGCSTPVFIGWYPTRIEAEAVIAERELEGPKILDGFCEGWGEAE